MFVFVCLLSAGLVRLGFTDDHKVTVTVLQTRDATLSCPSVAGDVSWSRLINGNHMDLATIANGREDIRDKRCRLLPNNTLVIHNVRRLDSGWYFCNRRKTVYLEVTTDPNMATTNAQGNNGFDVSENATDAGWHQSDMWKVAVGVVIGAVLMLLVMLVLRLWLDRRAERNTSRGGAPAEAIYEEVEDGSVQPRSESGVESPYYCSIITETPLVVSMPTNSDLYSVMVKKPRTPGRRGDECVYTLVHCPPQTGTSQWESSNVY